VTGFLYVLLSNGWTGRRKLDATHQPTLCGLPRGPHHDPAAIVFGQVANGFGCRTERESLSSRLVHEPFSRDRRARGIGIILVISYVPFVADIFKTGPLTLTDWVFLVISAVALFFAEEARKWFLRRKDRKVAAIGALTDGRETA